MATSTTTKRRGHAHRRSAAISGDFDSMGISFINSNSSNASITSPINDNNNEHSLPVGKRSDLSLNSKSSGDSLSSGVSSTETTPENSSKKAKSTVPYNINKMSIEELNYKLNVSSKYFIASPPEAQQEVPEALIDLDAALDVQSVSSSIKSKRLHRRTESAPEFDNLSINTAGLFTSNSLTGLSSGLSSLNTGGVLTNRKSFYSQLSPTTDVAIVEEESEDSDNETDFERDFEMYQNDNNNASATALSNEFSASSSVNSDTSGNGLFSPRLNGSAILQPPIQIGARRGRTAARYQNYYDNSKLIKDALRSTESLPKKASLPLLATNNKPSNSLLKNSKSLSPTKFNFEPVMYDISNEPLESLKQFQEKKRLNEEHSNNVLSNDVTEQTEIVREIKKSEEGPSEGHMKANSISVSATDNYTSKSQKLQKKAISHKRNSSLLDSITQLFTSSGSKRNDQNLDSVLSTPILRKFQNHSRSASKNSNNYSSGNESVITTVRTPQQKRNSKLVFDNQLSARTLTQQQLDNDATLKRKVSRESLDSLDGDLTVDPDETYFSISGSLKKKLSQQFKVDEKKKKNKNKLMGWLRIKDSL